MSMLPTAKTLLMALLSFFVLIGPELAKDIHSAMNPLIYVNNINNAIVIFDVSCKEVRNILHSLKNYSAATMNFPLLLGNFVWIAT